MVIEKHFVADQEGNIDLFFGLRLVLLSGAEEIDLMGNGMFANVHAVKREIWTTKKPAVFQQVMTWARTKLRQATWRVPDQDSGNGGVCNPH